MSAGPLPSVCFRSQSELRASGRGCGGARDYRSGRQAPTPFRQWTVPHGPSTDRPNEMESMYARPPHTGGGFTQQQSVQSHAAATAVAADLFPEPTGHAPQAIRFPEAAVRQSDCSIPGLNPLRVGLDLASQTREEMFGRASAPRAYPSFPLQVRSWESSEPTRTQLPSLVSNDTSSVEPVHPQTTDDDISDETHTFLCEWTDEHGTCNMNILGDRVWMSHHLSRYHHVVGHEKSQRACLWQGCTDTMNKGSLARHVVSRHLRAGASCGFCSKVYSRADVARRHAKKCKVANGVSVQHDRAKW